MSPEADQPRQRTVAELLAQHGESGATGRRRRRRAADDPENGSPAPASTDTAGTDAVAAGPGRRPAQQAEAEPLSRRDPAPRDPSAVPRSREAPAWDAPREPAPPREQFSRPDALPQRERPQARSQLPKRDAAQSGDMFQEPVPFRDASPRDAQGRGDSSQPEVSLWEPAGPPAASPAAFAPGGLAPGAPAPGGAPAPQIGSAPMGPAPTGPAPTGPAPGGPAPGGPALGSPALGSPALGSPALGSPAVPLAGGSTPLPVRSRLESPTEQIPRVAADRSGLLDPNLTGPIQHQRPGVLPAAPAGDDVDDARSDNGRRDSSRADDDAGPPTMVGAAPVGAEAWHRARTAGADPDGGPPTQAATPLGFDDFGDHPAGLGGADVEPGRAAPDSSAVSSTGSRRRGGAAAGEPASQSWAPVLAQWIIGAIGGAALWVGFRYLWGNLLVVAIAASVLVTIGLVVVVRALLRNNDMRTTVFAVLVGLLLTVSPAILVLIGR